jgi:hypothetical protein
MTQFKTCPWYLRILGFDYRYDMEVLSDPVQQGDNWIYNVEYKDSLLYWFNLRVWKNN